MKLVFIHDSEKVKIDIEGNMYTDGCYNADVWKRYNYLNDSMTVLMRKEDREYSVKDATRKFNIIDSDKIQFCELADTKTSLTAFFSGKLRAERRKVLEKELGNSDMVIVRLPGSEYAVSVARGLGKPLVLEVVGCPFDSLWNHSWKGKILALPMMMLLKHTVKNAPYVMYVTDNFLQHRYPTKGKAIGISDVVIEEGNSNILTERIAKIKSHKNKIILGTLGAINIKYKGHKYVFEALKYLKEHSIIDYEYWIVGNGEANYLQGLIHKYGLQENVKILGSIPHDKIFAWLDELDIYVQPSETEGLPRAVVEAMSRALPCITSNVGGLPELIEDEYTVKKSRSMGISIGKKIWKLTETEMIKMANRNFEKSKEFYRLVLEQKRCSFYDDFLKENSL